MLLPNGLQRVLSLRKIGLLQRIIRREQREIQIHGAVVRPVFHGGAQMTDERPRAVGKIEPRVNLRQRQFRCGHLRHQRPGAFKFLHGLKEQLFLLISLTQQIIEHRFVQRPPAVHDEAQSREVAELLGNLRDVGQLEFDASRMVGVAIQADAGGKIIRVQSQGLFQPAPRLGPMLLPLQGHAPRIQREGMPFREQPVLAPGRRGEAQQRGVARQRDRHFFPPALALRSVGGHERSQVVLPGVRPEKFIRRERRRRHSGRGQHISFAQLQRINRPAGHCVKPFKEKPVAGMQIKQPIRRRDRFQQLQSLGRRQQMPIVLREPAGGLPPFQPHAVRHRGQHPRIHREPLRPIAAVRQRGLEDRQLVRKIAQHDPAPRRQGVGSQVPETFQRMNIHVHDGRAVAHHQRRHQQPQQAHRARHPPSGRAVPAARAPKLDRLLQNEQQVPREEGRAQCVQVIERQQRQAAAELMFDDVARAVGRIEGQPQARQQEQHA